jgi:hypothetical protein
MQVRMALFQQALNRSFRKGKAPLFLANGDE